VPAGILCRGIHHFECRFRERVLHAMLATMALTVKPAGTQTRDSRPVRMLREAPAAKHTAKAPIAKASRSIFAFLRRPARLSAVRSNLSMRRSNDSPASIANVTTQPTDVDNLSSRGQFTPFPLAWR
jgi:hypothetical protein